MAIQSLAKIHLVFLTTCLFTYSCKKDDNTINAVPELQFESVSIEQNELGLDSTVFVKISYTDADGDIGYTDADTLFPFAFGDPFFYNLTVNFRYIEDGIEKPYILPFSTDTLSFSERLPNITPTGKSKSVKGTVTLKLRASPFPGFKPDSVYYSISLTDRALNRSNLLKTPTIRLVQ